MCNKICPDDALVIATSLSPSKLVAPPLLVELIVIVSVAASVVIVTFVPATNVRVSVLESATTFDWPATAIVVKLSDVVPPPPVASVPFTQLDPLYFST